jgi:type III secretory pathway component EscT
VNALFVDSWQRLLLAIGLGAARTVPLTWLVPALGGPRVAPEARIGLGILLAVLCLPVLAPAVASSPLVALGPVGWIVLAARELFVGLTVGLCVGAAFRAAEAAGRLVDLARGANQAEVLSPMSDERTSPTGDLYLFVSVVVFLELGGLRLFANALGRSYEAVPVAGASPLAFVGGLRPAAALVTATVGKLMESAIGLAAPVLVALWLADVTLGMVGRAAPQIPIYFAAMPAKALLGLGVVLLGLGAVDAAFVAGFPAWAAVFERAFAVWRPK